MDRVLLLLKSFFFLLLNSSFLQAGAYDPLSTAEIEKVREIKNVFVQSTYPDLISSGRVILETLLIERHAIKKGQEDTSERLADMYVYDYVTNTLNQLVINLDQNKVESITHDKEIQLPLTENEIQMAFNILTQDTVNFQLILEEFEQITGKPYSNPDQIQIKAFAFWGSSLPGVSNQQSLNCGIHRCAQVLIYTPDQVAFEVSPVIDLSIKKVIQNIKF